MALREKRGVVRIEDKKTPMGFIAVVAVMANYW